MCQSGSHVPFLKRIRGPTVQYGRHSLGERQRGVFFERFELKSLHCFLNSAWRRQLPAVVPSMSITTTALHLQQLA